MMKLLRIFLGTLMPLSLVTVLAALIPAVSGAERAIEARNTDLTRFLPADGNTVYPATGLLRAWTNDSPKLLWQTEVGGGRSAVVEANGRAFTAGQSEGKQWGICLDPKTGSILWKRRSHPPRITTTSTGRWLLRSLTASACIFSPTKT